jgi:hypothetical protein
MRYLIWMLVLSAIFTGCQSKIVPVGPMVKKIDSEELSRLVLTFSNEWKSVHHLELEDSWAAYDNGIKKICLRYSSQRLLDLKEARLLMVELVEEFLKRINNHTILGFELDSYPFTAEQLDVRINFESYFGMYVDPLYIGLTWLQAGCVHFYAFDRKDNDIDWDHHRFEPYSKSRELALIQKEIDLPFVEKIVPHKKPSSYIYDRYESYSPHAPYSPVVNYSPNMAPITTYRPVSVLNEAPRAPLVVSPTPMVTPPYGTVTSMPVNPYQASQIYPVGGYDALNYSREASVVTNPSPIMSSPTYGTVPSTPVNPYHSSAIYSGGYPTSSVVPPGAMTNPHVASPVSPYNPTRYASPSLYNTSLYNTTTANDLPPYNPNIPAGEQIFHNTTSDLPPYNPNPSYD